MMRLPSDHVRVHHEYFASNGVSVLISKAHAESVLDMHRSTHVSGSMLANQQCPHRVICPLFSRCALIAHS